MIYIYIYTSWIINIYMYVCIYIYMIYVVFWYPLKTKGQCIPDQAWTLGGPYYFGYFWFAWVLSRYLSSHPRASWTTMTGFNGCSSYCENTVLPQLDLLFGFVFLPHFSWVSLVWNTTVHCINVGMAPKKQLRSTEPAFGWLTSSIQPAKEAVHGRLAGQFAT